MQVDYPAVIQEDWAVLQRRERQLRGCKQEPRVRLLRLLKQNPGLSLARASKLLGYSEPQARRWWLAYQQQGLESLTADQPRAPRSGKMTEEAWQGLVEQMRAGRMARLEDARAFLARRYGIVYHSVNGVWYQFQRRRTKWKTGRRRHQKADARQQEAFP